MRIKNDELLLNKLRRGCSTIQFNFTKKLIRNVKYKVDLSPIAIETFGAAIQDVFGHGPRFGFKKLGGPHSTSEPHDETHDCVESRAV